MYNNMPYLQFASKYHCIVTFGYITYKPQHYKDNDDLAGLYGKLLLCCKCTDMQVMQQLK